MTKRLLNFLKIKKGTLTYSILGFAIIGLKVGFFISLIFLIGKFILFLGPFLHWSIDIVLWVTYIFSIIGIAYHFDEGYKLKEKKNEN
jgi:hypothetical protein